MHDDDWRSFPGAPAPGTVVGPSSAAPVGATALMVETGAGRFPLVLLRDDAGLRAFVNACPHQFLPLDHHGPRILSADGSKLMCTVHGAQFDAATGQGVGGMGLGCALDAVPVEETDGVIRIADA
ncbi:Rieske (2Fe-2S) protein [Rhodovulum sp. DZ06]|uniref:Rieske (2Fe-2S) protein n=1 Tax=Rhodovulum sp. DZ06 TaxID=3425126 RepID=UPI003D33C688